MSSCSCKDLVHSTLAHSGVVWLDVNRLDLAIFHQQGVALGADVAEEGGGVEAQVEGVGEGAAGVGEEVDL